MNDRPSVIYKITNSVNGKCYIGVTYRGIEKRLDEHWRDARKGQTRHLQRAMMKYGRDAFSIEKIADAVNKREAIAIERGTIAAHGTLSPRGYNLSMGGDGGIGMVHTASARKKLSDAMKRPENANKHKAGLLAMHSAESRTRLAASVKERWSDPSNCAKRKERQGTPEMRAKLKAGQIHRIESMSADERSAERARNSIHGTKAFQHCISIARRMMARKINALRKANLMPDGWMKRQRIARIYDNMHVLMGLE